MRKRFYKELWSLRFAKMLQLEEQSVLDYEALLEESRRRFKAHPIIPHLEKLILDERRHARLVQELLRILERQPDTGS